jgi:hypothetical protein
VIDTQEIAPETIEADLEQLTKDITFSAPCADEQVSSDQSVVVAEHSSPPTSQAVEVPTTASSAAPTPAAPTPASAATLTSPTPSVSMPASPPAPTPVVSAASPHTAEAPPRKSEPLEEPTHEGVSSASSASLSQPDPAREGSSALPTGVDDATTIDSAPLADKRSIKKTLSKKFFRGNRKVRLARAHVLWCFVLLLFFFFSLLAFPNFSSHSL